MANELALKLTKQEAWSYIKRDLFNWRVLACFGFVLSGPLWYSALTYFFIWTFLFDSNAIFVWTIVVAVFAVFIYSWVLYWRTTRRAKGMRQLRLAALAGDDEAKDEYLERRRQLRAEKSTGWLLFLGLAAVQVLVPVIIALTVYGGTTEGTYAVRDHGKVRVASRREGVRIVLDRLNKEGMFWVVN